MTINLRVTGTVATSAAATSLGATIPAVKEGDFMLLAVAVRTATVQSFGGAAGWTLYGSLSSTNPNLAVYYKFAGPSDAGATVTPSWQTSINCAAVVLAYTGVDATTPIDTFGSAFNASSVTTVGYGSLINDLNNLVVSFGTINAAAFSAGTPTGYTNRVNNTTQVGLSISDNFYEAGSTGSITSTAGTAVSNEGAIICLRPSQGPAFRAAGAATTVAATSFSVLHPAHQIGDLLVVQFMSQNGAAQNITPPAGWTRIGTFAAAGNSRAGETFYKIATTTTTTETGWTAAVTTNTDYQSYAVAGVDATNPVIASEIAGSTGTSITFNGLTSTSADGLLFHTLASNGAPPTTPVGMTNEVSGATATWTHTLFDENFSPSNGSTGSRVTTLGATIDTVGAMLLLKRAANAPKVRGTATSFTPNAASTSLAVNVPANVQNGDLMVAMVAFKTTAGTITPPAGWTEIESDTTNSMNWKAYTRVASSEPSTYTWSWVNSIGCQATVTAIIGGASLDLDGRTYTANNTTVSFPSITTTGSPRLLLFGYSVDTSTTQFTPPVGAVEIADIVQSGFGTNQGMGLSYEIQPSAAATGARTLTATQSGNNQGYVVALIGNQPPNTPTALTRTDTTQTVATPSFSAAMSDPDTNQQVKVRFEIWDRARTTLQGTVDSALATNPATVTATYSSTLAIGSYSVKAFAIDAIGATSGYTAFVDFDVTQYVTHDETLLWDVRQNTVHDETLIWNVSANNLKDLTFLWNVLVPSAAFNVTLLWGVDPIWTNVPLDEDTPTWQEVAP